MDALERKQRERLKLGAHRGLTTKAPLAKFLANVGVALRYGPGAGLPLASVYAAVGDERRAAVLTNALIEDGAAIETNAIAGRVALLASELAPAVVALARRGGDISDAADRVLGYIANAERPTAGQVRAFLGVPPKTWPNAADDALAELQRATLIDRGATAVPETGAPYLGKDGIPYRVFDRAHPAIVKAAAKLTVATAAPALLARYLSGAVFAKRRKLASLFGALMSKPELAAAIDALVADGRVTVDGELVFAR